MSGADLRKVQLGLLNLNEVILTGADLSEAVMVGTYLYQADLKKVQLKGAYLSGIMLCGANLSEADLTSANLLGTNFSLNGTTNEGSMFSGEFTNLRGANLSNATIMQTNFSNAILDDADLSNASLFGAIFANVDLSLVKGLETVTHQGPSTIGIDTIYQSRGNIPEVFLRNAGVPDSFLTYMRSIVDRPFEYFSCFISHSSKDKRFCDRLYADLQANGVRTWYFPEDATWGETVWGEIDRSIKIYDKLVVVCSEHSLQSGPVQREIERALNREDRERKNILFPIRIDNYLFDYWQHERKDDLLRKVIGDFRGWNQSTAKYDAALKKLLKALNSQEVAKP